MSLCIKSLNPQLSVWPGFGQMRWQKCVPKNSDGQVGFFQPTERLWTSLAISYGGGHLVMPLTDGQRQTVIGCQALLCLKRKEEELERRPAINNQPRQVNKVFGDDGHAGWGEKKKKSLESKPNPSEDGCHISSLSNARRTKPSADGCSAACLREGKVPPWCTQHSLLMSDSDAPLSLYLLPPYKLY